CAHARPALAHQLQVEAPPKEQLTGDTAYGTTTENIAAVEQAGIRAYMSWSWSRAVGTICSR
ncbi:MAG TPA: hypothetical protein VI055_00005, partial [Rubrobacter sp.]